MPLRSAVFYSLCLGPEDCHKSSSSYKRINCWQWSGKAYSQVSICLILFTSISFRCFYRTNPERGAKVIFFHQQFKYFCLFPINVAQIILQVSFIAAISFTKINTASNMFHLGKNYCIELYLGQTATTINYIQSFSRLYYKSSKISITFTISDTAACCHLGYTGLWKDPIK